MTGLVEQRVYRGIRTHEDRTADDAGFRLAPERSRNGDVIANLRQLQAEPRQQGTTGPRGEFADTQDVAAGRRRVQMPDSCIMTTRTRSSAIASRSSASSFSLPSTRVSSQV